jgi:hypothetical protein
LTDYYCSSFIDYERKNKVVRRATDMLVAGAEWRWCTAQPMNWTSVSTLTISPKKKLKCKVQAQGERCIRRSQRQVEGCKVL